MSVAAQGASAKELAAQTRQRMDAAKQAGAAAEAARRARQR